MQIQKIGNALLNFLGTPVEEIKKVDVLGVSKSSLTQNADNSFLVDERTGTKIYYGQSAKYYLEHCKKFEKNTQIIAQSGTGIEVTCYGGGYTLDEPGAIVIDKGTEANIKVLKGSPLVIEYDSKPYWYNDLEPDNEHYKYFAYLAKKNHEIFNCGHRKKISPYQNPGEVKEEDFTYCPSWVFSKLYNNHLIVDNPENHTTNWGGYWDNDNFQKDLYEQAGIYGDVKNRIMGVWHDTTKSGYDLSGLVKTFDGISIYTHKDKFNQHNNQPTEWITNSTLWPNSEHSMIGVSRVTNLDSTEPREMNSIRPGESVHLHQQYNNPDHNSREIYIPTQGQAILFTLIDGKPHYIELKEGEVAIVPEGVEHGVIAVSGEYEHLCAQTPCTFQYGLDFKNIVRPFDDEEKKEAIKKLTNIDAVEQYEAIQKMSREDEKMKAQQPQKPNLLDKIFGRLK